MSFPEMSPISVVIGPFPTANLVEGTDQEWVVWRAPAACEITEVWTVLNAAIGAGTLQVTLLDKGQVGTATGSAIAQHGTATAYAADTPADETISEGTIDEGDYVSVKWENEATGTTISVNGLVVGLEYVCGYPAAEG